MRSAVWLVLSLSVHTLAAQARRPWRAADLDHLVSVGEPSLRSDGTQLVYVRGRADLAANANRSEVVLVATETGRVLQSWDGGSPRWSPNGREVVYGASRDGKSGIWIRNVEAGTDRFLVATPQTDAWLGRGTAKNVDRVRGGRAGGAGADERCQGFFSDHAQDQDWFFRQPPDPCLGDRGSGRSRSLADAGLG